MREECPFFKEDHKKSLLFTELNSFNTICIKMHMQVPLSSLDLVHNGKKKKIILVITFGQSFILLNCGIINIMQSFFMGGGGGGVLYIITIWRKNMYLEKLIEAADWRLFLHVQVGHMLMQRDTGIESNQSL